jgi:hypothetical protein
MIITLFFQIVELAYSRWIKMTELFIYTISIMEGDLL